MNKDKKKLFAEIKNNEIKYGIFESSNDSDYNLIHTLKSKNDGIKYGHISDLNVASKIIGEDLNKIEKKLHNIFDKINLIINQREMFSTSISSFKNLNGAKVEKRDLEYILNEGKILISNNNDRNNILHILNSSYYLDKKKKEKIPLNIFADHLGLSMTFISLPNNNIKNLKNLFENNDLKVDRILCRPVTTCVKLINHNNSLKNFFLINIDDELSTISFYNNFSLIFFKTFPFGTNSIYKDLKQLCSISEDETKSILDEYDFDIKKETKIKYIDKKFFKETQFTKISFSHFREIIEARVNEMLNYIYIKNPNLSYFKESQSHILLVFENKIFQKNLGNVFEKLIKSHSEKVILKSVILEDISMLGAAELTYKGWHAEALPYIQEKKSIFANVFSRIFQ